MKDRIKKVRGDAGLTQKQFAEKLSVNRLLISQWETGAAKPGKMRLYQIADLFGVRREWLENGAGEMFAPEKAPKSQSEILQDAAYTLLKAVNSDVRDAVVKAVERISSES